MPTSHIPTLAVIYNDEIIVLIKYLNQKNKL